MIHLRQLIRKQIIDQLMGLPITGPRVYDSRIYMVDFTEIPALIVTAQSEELEVSNLTAPRDLERDISYLITAYVTGHDDYADTLDSISANVEFALSNDLTINGLAKDILLDNVVFDFESGTDPIGRMEMTYTVSYRTKENNAEIST